MLQAVTLQHGSLSGVNGPRRRTLTLIYHKTKAIFLSSRLDDNSSASHIISPSTLRSVTETVCLS